MHPVANPLPQRVARAALLEVSHPQVPEHTCPSTTHSEGEPFSLLCSLPLSINSHFFASGEVVIIAGHYEDKEVAGRQKKFQTSWEGVSNGVKEIDLL